MVLKVKIAGYAIASLLLIFLLLEIVLRFAFGFGNPPLVQRDEMIGYRFQPNQKMKRFGHQIEYNQYSQRSDPITPQKPPQGMRILMLGDSVLNGGNRTDQQETISEQLETKLKEQVKQIEVLNASANSWGIGNQWGYLQKFGLFESEIVILQIGTHDLVQATSKGENVYPTERPFLAIGEVITDYILPRFRNQEKPAVPSPSKLDKQFGKNREIVGAIASFVRQQKASLLILYTPNRSDLYPHPHHPPYQLAFRQFLQQEKIPIIDIYQAWQVAPPATIQSYFNDSVHLSIKGQEAVANELFRNLQNHL